MDMRQSQKQKYQHLIVNQIMGNRQNINIFTKYNSDSADNLYINQNNIVHFEELNIPTSQEQYDYVLKLYRSRRGLIHPNVIKLVQVIEAHNYCSYSIRAFYQYTPFTLEDQLRQKSSFTERQLKILIEQIVQGVQALQVKMFVWKWLNLKDIKKSKNWLINDRSIKQEGKVGQIGLNLYQIMLELCPDIDKSAYSKTFKLFLKSLYKNMQLENLVILGSQTLIYQYQLMTNINNKQWMSEKIMRIKSRCFDNLCQIWKDVVEFQGQKVDDTQKRQFFDKTFANIIHTWYKKNEQIFQDNLDDCSKLLLDFSDYIDQPTFKRKINKQQYLFQMAPKVYLMGELSRYVEFPENLAQLQKTKRTFKLS